MWSSETKTGNLNRRAVLAGLGALSLAACGFTPVYAPGGGGSRLLNAVSLQAPDDDRRYVFNRRFEERLGRPASGAPYALTVRIQVTEQDIGVTREVILAEVDALALPIMDVLREEGYLEALVRRRLGSFYTSAAARKLLASEA